MSYILTTEEIETIAGMSYKERVSLLFKMFPKYQAYFEELYISTLDIKRGVKISYSMESLYVVEIYIEGLGTIKKFWENDELSDKKIYRFSFCVGEDYGPGTKSEPLSREDSDIMCDRILPFMLSYGHDKRKIPLLINDYPEFAKFALEYVATGA